jgi:hypothetical protein
MGESTPWLGKRRDRRISGVNRLLPSPAMVVACTALVVALGGTGYAAATINGNALKDRTVAATKLKRDSVGATEIREDTLQTVPRAAGAGRADTAARADSAAHADSATAADSAADLPDLAFVNLTLEKGWTKYLETRAPAAALDAQGIVHLRGGMSDGTSPYTFTLPADMRPAQDVYVPAGFYNGRGGRLFIHTDGRVYVSPEGPFTDASAFTSLEGVTFDAGD